MTAPASDEGPITFINVFDIAEDEIDTFIARWKERTRFMISANGFLSAELNRATDPETRFRLINITHWASRAHFEAAIHAPAYRAELEQYQETANWTAHRGFYSSVALFEHQADRTAAAATDPVM